MISINEFKDPEVHPYGMLQGYTNANEKESLLCFLLGKCIEANAWVAVTTKYSHPTMVEDGLLEMVGISQYLLTEKAKGLLYTVYHK